MQEALVILPVNDNNGRPVPEAHDYLAKALFEEFGGATYRYAAQGVDPVQPQGEDVLCYFAAYDNAEGDGDAALAQIAFTAWRMAGQNFGYVRFADGTVQIVDIWQAHRTGRIPLAKAGRFAAVPGFKYVAGLADDVPAAQPAHRCPDAELQPALTGGQL